MEEIKFQQIVDEKMNVLFVFIIIFSQVECHILMSCHYHHCYYYDYGRENELKMRVE